MSATAFFFFLSMLQLIHNNSADAINSGLIGTGYKKISKDCHIYLQNNMLVKV